MTRRSYAGAAPLTALAAGITAGSSSFTVESGGGSGYPTGSNGPFFVALDEETASEEKILVADRTGDVFTVAGGGRGADDTTAVSHSLPCTVRHVYTATDADEANEHVNTDAGVHGTSSAVMGLTDAQTPTNKTWDGNDNTFQNIALASLLLGAGWETPLAVALGSNWVTAFANTLGANWTDALDTALGSGWPAQLAAAVASGDLLTDTSTATVTNKTLDGDANTFTDIPADAVDAYVLRKRGQTGNTVNSGVEAAPMSNNIVEINSSPGGNWDLSGSHSSQWTFPVTGIYYVTLSYEFQRSSVSQTGPIHLRLRSGVTPGDPDTGSVIRSITQGYPSGTMGTENSIQLNVLLNITSTSTGYGVTISNQGNDTITIDDDGADLREISIFRNGPT